MKKHSAITIHAPHSTYNLIFKHLRGAMYTPPSGETLYFSGGHEYTVEELVSMMMESVEPLPENMLKGHTLATAAYVFRDYHCVGEYEVGLSIMPPDKVTRDTLRRVALTEAIATLPTVDRAYFHLYLSMLEGRKMGPIIRSALTRRLLQHDRDILVRHILGDPHMVDDEKYLYRNILTPHNSRR